MIEVIKSDDPPVIGKVSFKCDAPFGDIKAPLPDRFPISMLISGRPGSGKSTFMVNLLTQKELYKHRFDHIFLFMPRNSLESLPNNSPLRKHDKIYHELNGEILDNVEEQCKANALNDEINLIIIDDFLHAMKRKDIQQTLQQIISNSRHQKTAIIILTQIYNSLSLLLRKELSHLVVYRSGNRKEVKSLCEEQLVGMPEKEAEEVLEFCWKDRHSFIFIDVNNRAYYDSDFNQIVVKK